MIAKTEQYLLRALVALVALSVAALVLLPDVVAEAQEDGAAAVGDALSANQNAGATAAASQHTSEPATRLVVGPGDSLWLIAQRWLGPNATLAQIDVEVDRIYELNRWQIGDDPNLIFPGQELLMAPLAAPAVVDELVQPAIAPATAEPAVTEPAAVEPATKSGATSEPTDEPAPETEASEQPASEPRTDAPVEEAPAKPNTTGRQAIGLVVLGLTLLLLLAVAIRTGWKLARERRQRRGGSRNNHHHENHGRQRHHHVQEAPELTRLSSAVSRNGLTPGQLKARRMRARRMRARRSRTFGGLDGRPPKGRW